jgi:hypothetical protein
MHDSSYPNHRVLGIYSLTVAGPATRDRENT